MERVANLTPKALESCYCQGLVQSIVAQNELQRRMARNSRKILELDNALADCHRTIEQRDEDLRAQHQRVAELEARLQGLEIGRHTMEEKLGRSQERIRELEERYANPTQLLEVKEYIRRELQGVWKRGFLRCKEECKKPTLTLTFPPSNLWMT